MKTQIYWIVLIVKALKLYSGKKIGAHEIIPGEVDERNDVTGKIFFCKAGKYFHPKF